MENLALVGLILGSSWASGVNLYLTMAGLGIAHRMSWIVLPGDLEILANPLIITVASLLYLIEFFADKIPAIDTIWDAFHTLIRPLGGALLAYLAMTDASPAVQYAAAMVGGGIALDSHITKASSRALINTSPEPFSNTAASVTEDAMVVGSLWLIMTNPIVIAVLVILFLLLSFWLVPKLWRLFKKIFAFFFKGNNQGETIAQPTEG